jgi:hypothetical protein
VDSRGTGLLREAGDQFIDLLTEDHHHIGIGAPPWLCASHLVPSSREKERSIAGLTGFFNKSSTVFHKYGR